MSRRDLPVDSSWRMVEGENDSFDTTMLPEPSSGQPSFSVPSQQTASSFAASQDSIGDFTAHHDDDRVILREPFRPSMLSSGRAHSSSSATTAKLLRSAEPLFRMPLLDVDDTSSASTARPPRYEAHSHTSSPPRRRRKPSASLATPTKPSSTITSTSNISFLSTIARSAHRLAIWIADVILIAMAYAKYPLAALLAVYLVCGSFIIAQNMATRSLYSAASPLCRIPGASSLLRLPFCASPSSSNKKPPLGTVEFDDLMGVQSQFEQVLERAADGVSLPFEMKRSETAVRDLRTLVSHSDVQSRHELVLEFDGYISTARRAALDLQRFNAHVGSAVDGVISINRWTSRYIDSLAPPNTSPSLPSRWSSWFLSPISFLSSSPSSSTDRFSQRAILDQYVEHTSLVSDRIAALILEAQALLRLLTRAEDHLSLIYDIASRSSALAASRREELLWTLWTLVGANSARLSSLSRQLDLLRRVDAQRSTAVAQVSALVLDLESIQARLGDLRDRVAEPRLAAAADVGIPLAVHIETIDRGVERLQDARARLRVAEDDRVREALARAASHDDRLLDARQP
ncbi:hypothetical protein CDD80_6117 [Ophiocordyceps camponoti-rufipedis]|uniref:Uncharacterized protein n=1 Tax=Ophiocordyceps camponoti-rufipedis TaxID=2004952 RepID=A0A2C5YL94_9HYPO|nr:hypothetical protein CDD80_6117 [Ophiocordyceps camponoti-rufipedis]